MFEIGTSGKRKFVLFKNEFYGGLEFVLHQRSTHIGVGSVDGPCKAGDGDAGFSAKASKSLRTADDCLRAELNSEFCTSLDDI